MGKYKETEKDGKYWIDKKKFYSAIVEHRKRQKIDPMNQMPDYIGQCITNIAHGVMSRYNFNRYSYRDEMISDAILTCIKYYNTFDINRSENPYGYFWLASYRAGQRKVILEKEQQAIRAKTVQNMVLDDDMVSTDELLDFTDYMNEFFDFDLDQYNISRSKKLKKSKISPVNLILSKTQREQKEKERSEKSSK